MPSLQGLFDRHLEDDEEVIVIVHRHWIFGFRYLFYPTLSFLAAWVLLYFFPFSKIFYAAAIWACVSLIWWLRNFFDYYLDAWIITDQGIIDIEWHGWFHRQSSRVLYSDIQGVSYEIQGVMSTLFRYGLISIEKVSSGSVIEMEHAPNPRAIEAVILKNMEDYLNDNNLKDSRHVQDVLAAIVAREIQLGEFESDDDDEEEYDDDDES